MRTNEYKVYVIKSNKTEQIVYVGLTRQTLKQRYDDHVKRFKFLRCDYRIEQITSDLTIEQAAELETRLIAQYNTLETGWNKSPGSINGYSNYHSEKQKQKWREERPGCKVSEEHAAKNRVARLGQKSSPEHRAKIAEKHCKQVMCLENGQVYKSARQAAKELGVNYCRISDVCNGKRATTGNLHCVFVKKKQ